MRTRSKRILLTLVLVLAGIMAGTAAAFYFGFLGFGSVDMNSRVSFLLIGTDKRPGDHSYNADSIIVASFDPRTKLVSLLSIPRDTRVALSGGKDYCKINALPSLKGIPELEKQVTALTGIKLNGYVLTNFQGFKEIIDTLGGITIDVEKNMYYETGDEEDGYINLKAGVQKLNGTKALQYARFRHDDTADIGRTARQQKVLTAVAKKALEPVNILKMPALIPQFMKAVETDLALKDLTTLAGAANSFSDAKIVSQTLPGNAIMLDGLSYWEVNKTKAREVAQNLLLGQTTSEIWDSSVMDSLDAETKARLDSPKTETVIEMPEISGVTIPKEGEEPVKTIQTEQYSGTVVWSPDDQVFVAGQKYQATITLEPKAGYTLKGIRANFFTVPGATAANAAGSGVITAQFPAVRTEPETAPEEEPEETAPAGTAPAENTATVVSRADIAGVIPPKAGAEPVTMITPTEQYSGSVIWAPADKPFEQGRQYTAVIILVPKAGYTMEGIGQNFFTVAGAAATNDPGSGIIKAAFPATE